MSGAQGPARRNSLMTIAYRPIGFIRSPHHTVTGMPIQPSGARGVRGVLEVLPEFAAVLKDLEGFSHVFLVYHLHKICGHSLLVTPFLDTDEHGIFATRSPRRPNPIGLSALKLVGVQDNVVELENVDILDGTPVLDVKPYVADFDVWPATRFGWFEGKSTKAETVRSDARFAACSAGQPQP
jgi:tRNA-Thr(GGU) m(6)t(6)A37 methyltransferase TsaA